MMTAGGHGFVPVALHLYVVADLINLLPAQDDHDKR